MPKSRIYLAYGSNLNVRQMAERCPTARMLGTAELIGYELLFRGKPQRAVATIEPKEGASAPVLLWKLRPRDEAALDHFEGVPKTYAKQTVEVEYGKNSVVAMTYVMTPGFYAGLPSAEYLGRIAVGYDRAGFDFGILNAALERSKEIMKQELAALEQQYGARDTLNGDSLLYLSSLFDRPRLHRQIQEDDDGAAFLEEITKNHPGGAEALDEEQAGRLLSLFSEYQSGEIEWDELEDQSREYLSGLDEPDTRPGNLFDMKWGCY